MKKQYISATVVLLNLSEEDVLTLSSLASSSTANGSYDFEKDFNIITKG